LGKPVQSSSVYTLHTWAPDAVSEHNDEDANTLDASTKKEV
jgi:hypothetical protein